MSETFVTREIAAMIAMGVNVRVFPLGEPARDRPAIAAVIPKKAAVKGLAWALRLGAGEIRLTTELLRNRSWRELSRLAYAVLRAGGAMAALAKHPPTHVHAHFLARPADVGRIIARATGANFSVTAHAGDAYMPWEPLLYSERIASASAIVAASGHVAATLLARHADKRVAVVHCGIDFRELPSVVPQKERRGLITVGRMVPTKGYLELLDVLPAVMDEHPTLEWHIYGDGPLYTQVQNFFSSTAFRDRVILHGSVTNEAVLSAIARSSCFVLPALPSDDHHGDGLPVVLMEALALETAVVSTAFAGIPELVTPDVGYLVPPFDKQELSRAIRAALTQEAALRAEAARRGRAMVQERFNVATEARILAEQVWGISVPTSVRGLDSDGR
ncbi:glycosyltransferase family 4 protein [Cellulomonas marina]|nr:glycosyltransferase family 4 protein [Cellulomonas marina]